MTTNLETQECCPRFNPASWDGNVTLNGKFLSKVYEGYFEKTGEWCQDFEAYAKNQGLEINKWYMWYTTCPACAEKYEKNYVVVVAEV